MLVSEDMALHEHYCDTAKCLLLKWQPWCTRMNVCFTSFWLYIQGKVRFLCVSWRCMRKWRCGCTHSFLCIRYGEWLASQLSQFTPGDRDPGAQWKGGWVGHRDIWTLCRREKKFYKRWAVSISCTTIFFWRSCSVLRVLDSSSILLYNIAKESSGM
jgi:hypothetical protein